MKLILTIIFVLLASVCNAEDSRSLRVAQNKAEFDKILKSAEKGDISAQRRLGDIYNSYEYGSDFKIEPNSDKAFKWYLKAAGQGDAISQARLGDWYTDTSRNCEEEQGLDCFSPPSDKDMQEALKWYKKAADDGDKHAQDVIGIESKAKEAKEKAEKGDVDAQVYLGNYYYYKDKKKALEWYLKASENGSKKIQHVIGDIYSGDDDGYFCCGDGEILESMGGERPRDNKKALEWYLKAVEVGDVNGFLYAHIANFYNPDWGVLRTSAKPNEYFKWMLKAKELGYLSGNEIVINTYYKGAVGMPVNYPEAYKWCGVTAGHGPSESFDACPLPIGAGKENYYKREDAFYKDLKEFFKGKLTRQQMVEGDKFIKEWLGKYGEEHDVMPRYTDIYEAKQ